MFKGNLFELAEMQLIKEKKFGLIPCYSIDDVLEYAIFIRKQLDRRPNEIKKIMRLTLQEKKKQQKEKRKMYYLKTGR
jgi:hypothetical protein